MSPEQPVLIYDGDCGFCRRSLDWGIRNLTAFPRHLPSKHPEVKTFGLNDQQLAEQVWLVGPGLRRGGASAVAYLLRMQPNLGYRSLGWLMTIFLPLSNITYRYVARNRGKWGKK